VLHVLLPPGWDTGVTQGYPPHFLLAPVYFWGGRETAAVFLISNKKVEAF